jgi:alkanesulfonate monooxygenase SsuD/methylene tetrahydromethanopterin reductase-like flavin-dependent oxidoreductase (luciferase family)
VIRVDAKGPHFGFKLPNCGGVMCPPDWATPETVEALARQAAKAGFQSLWLQDHVLTPRELEHLPDPAFLEPITVALVLASIVPLQIGIATLVLPLRDPVVLAKQLATASRFFPGRFIAGMGSGRYRSEFESFGSDQFDDRGKVLEDYLKVIQALFSEDRVTSTGGFRPLTDAEMYPKPRPGDLSIWVAANGPVGVRRAARLGDGWIVGSPQLSEFKVAVDTYRKARGQVGRSLSAPAIALSLTVDRDQGTAAPDGPELHRHAYTLRGTSAEVAAALGTYVAAGATHFLMTFPSATLSELAQKMDWFATEVRPHVTAD